MVIVSPLHYVSRVCAVSAVSLSDHDTCYFPDTAGSGKTLAFLLPIIAALHQKKYDQQQQQQHQKEQQQQQEASGSTKRTSESAEHNPRPGTKHSKPSEVSSTLPSASKAANSTSETVKGKSGKAEGSVELSKGPSAVILAPSRELAAQTARCLLLLLKGLKLRCTLLTAAVAAGTDFSKVILHLILFIPAFFDPHANRLSPLQEAALSSELCCAFHTLADAPHKVKHVTKAACI